MQWEHKVIRDPICGYIGLTEREVGLLDTPILQRLRRIRQLGFTDFVYPGATHSRFEHSLGCLWVADKIAQKLCFNDTDRVLVRFAALLHDAGHGPLSHIFENILTSANGREISHEDVIAKLLPLPEICEKLEDFFLPLSQIFQKPREESLISDIISGSLDVDKIDYLRRDSYYTGVAYGIFDFERILYMMTSDDEQKHLAVKEKGKDALESFRLARYLMHVQVYQHHVRAIADAMFIRAAEIALNNNEELRARLIFGDEKFTENFLLYSDERFKRELLEKGPENTKRLIGMLERRELFKRGYEKDLNQLDILKRRKIMKMSKQDFSIMEGKIATDSGVEKEFVIVYPFKVDNPVYIDPDKLLREETPILIQKQDGEIISFDEVSPISGSTQKYIQKLFVFCPDEFKNVIGENTERYLNALA